MKSHTAGLPRICLHTRLLLNNSHHSSKRIILNVSMCNVNSAQESKKEGKTFYIKINFLFLLNVVCDTPVHFLTPALQSLFQ
jgi:hypothetical protein